MPMTLISSIYGMNFAHMPELKWAWGYPFALSLMVMVGVLLLVLFKWRKWF
jgi:magnesium transporter